jgi:hypothetical protein
VVKKFKLFLELVELNGSWWSAIARIERIMVAGNLKIGVETPLRHPQ